jgi:polar amino acid transport system permease protein
MTYSLDLSALVPYWPVFLRGAWLTLKMTAIAVVIGTLAGIAVAFIKRARVPLLSTLCAAYIEVIRNTPFLVQIFILYFGLASLEIRMPTFAAAVLAMVVNIGAYSAEIVRAGLDSVPRGQIEAAQCLGLSRWRIGWHVMLQPALENVYPALTSQYLLMMQASAMASQISAEELTAIANTVQSDTFRSLETYLVIAALYVTLSVAIKWVSALAGRMIFKRTRVLRATRASSLRRAELQTDAAVHGGAA